MDNRNRRAYSSQGEPVDSGAFDRAKARRFQLIRDQKGPVEPLAKKVEKPVVKNAAEVEQPLSIDGAGGGMNDGSVSGAKDALVEAESPMPGAIYGRQVTMDDLKDAHNERESSKEWNEHLVEYQPVKAAEPDGKVLVRVEAAPAPAKGAKASSMSDEKKAPEKVPASEVSESGFVVPKMEPGGENDDLIRETSIDPNPDNPGDDR